MVKVRKQIRYGLPLVGVPPYGQVHLHSTGNRNSTAQNEADYMGRKDINSGFFTHVVGNGEAIQVAETNRGAWDVGGGWNQWGYASIELIESHKNFDEFYRDYKIYIELARQLADEAGIPKKLDSGELGVLTHQYCTYNQPYNGSDHIDPYPYLAKWGITKEQLRKDIENGISGSAPSAPAPKPQTPSKPSQSSSEWIKETGVYRPDSATNLRTGASTSSGVIATLPPKSVIKYDAFKVDTNGYLWIRQPRSGGYGYMATGRTQNGKRVDWWGSFSAS